LKWLDSNKSVKDSRSPSILLLSGFVYIQVTMTGDPVRSSGTRLPSGRVRIVETGRL